VATRIGERDMLVRIKRAVLAGQYSFSEKASLEMERDGLTELDEAILNAVAIFKRVRSTSASRVRRREYLYIIQSTNLEGLLIYTKGKFVKEAGRKPTTFWYHRRGQYNECTS
jgi:hypothetical protein